MADEPKPMDGREWSLLILLSLLWGGAFFFIGVSVRELPPLTVVLVRVGLAALFLLPLFYRYGHAMPRTAAAWMPFFVMGVLNNVLPFSLLAAGQTEVTVGLAAIINAMTPLFTVLVMAGFGEERLTVHRVIGVLLGVLGVAVLRGFDVSAELGQTVGIALCLLATLSYGFSALWGRRYLAGVAPIKSATCQLICSSLVMAVLVAAFDQPWTLPMPSVATWLALIGLAILGTAIAYIVFFEILVRAGASNAMLVTLLMPISALLLGNTFLDEAIRAREIAGALLIGSGLLFIDGRVISWIMHRYRP